MVNATGRGNQVNTHSQLDKGSAWATGTLYHTTHRNKPGMGRHLVISGGYRPPNTADLPHVPHMATPRMASGQVRGSSRSQDWGFICPEVNQRVLSRARRASGLVPRFQGSLKTENRASPRPTGSVAQSSTRAASHVRRQLRACSRLCWKGWAGCDRAGVGLSGPATQAGGEGALALTP